MRTHPKLVKYRCSAHLEESPSGPWRMFGEHVCASTRGFESHLLRSNTRRALAVRRVLMNRKNGIRTGTGVTTPSPESSTKSAGFDTRPNPTQITPRDAFCYSLILISSPHPKIYPYSLSLLLLQESHSLA